MEKLILFLVAAAAIAMWFFKFKDNLETDDKRGMYYLGIGTAIGMILLLLLAMAHS